MEFGYNVAAALHVCSSCKFECVLLVNETVKHWAFKDVIQLESEQLYSVVTQSLFMIYLCHL